MRITRRAAGRLRAVGGSPAGGARTKLTTVEPARQRGGRLLPQGGLDALRQLLLFAAAYYLYNLVRGAVDGDVATAYQNARTLVEAERALGLFFEPGVQSWALSNPWIVDVASWIYVNSHFVVTSAFLVWLYLRRNEAFCYVRNVMMVAMGIALVGYTLFPTAPPRFLPEWGFTDTVVNLVGEQAARGAEVLYNPFAAVPSMHVAFALIVGVSAAMLVRRRALSILWALYPVLVVLTVIVTANHFWLDAVFGAMVAGAAAYAAHSWLARARPEAWAFRPRIGEATA